MHLVVILSCCSSYHLQALRHLAVLAAEPRLLVPVDVDSLKPCYALLEVTYKVSKSMRFVSGHRELQRRAAIPLLT